MARAAAGFSRRMKSRTFGVAEIGVVHGLDQRAGNGVGGLGKADQPVDRFGEFGCAARAVPHLAFDEARIDGAGAHDAGDSLADRARPRPRRIGGVERDQVGAAAERCKRCGKAADEGDVGRAFEHVAAGIVAGVDQQLGTRQPLLEGAGRCLAIAVGAAEGVRGGFDEGAADLFARLPFARRKQVFDAGAIGSGRRAEDAPRRLCRSRATLRRAGCRHRPRRAPRPRRPPRRSARSGPGTCRGTGRRCGR